MTALEQLVPSLEVCQQLKASGFRQNTALAWYPTREVGAVSATVWVVDVMSSDMLCAAPAFSELLDMLGEKDTKLKMTALAHALIALHEEAI